MRIKEEVGGRTEREERYTQILYYYVARATTNECV